MQIDFKLCREKGKLKDIKMQAIWQISLQKNINKQEELPLRTDRDRDHDRVCVQKKGEDGGKMCFNGVPITGRKRQSVWGGEVSLTLWAHTHQTPSLYPSPSSLLSPSVTPSHTPSLTPRPTLSNLSSVFVSLGCVQCTGSNRPQHTPLPPFTRRGSHADMTLWHCATSAHPFTYT